MWGKCSCLSFPETQPVVIESLLKWGKLLDIGYRSEVYLFILKNNRFISICVFILLVSHSFSLIFMLCFLSKQQIESKLLWNLRLNSNMELNTRDIWDTNYEIGSKLYMFCKKEEAPNLQELCTRGKIYLFWQTIIYSI